MRILDRYVLKDLVIGFLSCLFVFLFLYIIIDVFSHLDEILKQRIDTLIILRYYYTFFPIIFIQTSPVACLLATLFCLGRLNRNNEIIAMRSSGLSIFKISRALIIFGLIITIFVFFVNEKLVPYAQQANQQLKQTMFKKDKSDKEDVINNFTLYGLKNRLFYINQFFPRKKYISGVIILQQDENQNLVSKIVAESGNFKEGRWIFKNMLIYNFNEEGKIVGEPLYFEERITDIEEDPDYLMEQRREVSFMNIAQLRDYIKRLSESGAETALRNLKVDLYRRFSFPFANLIILILGIPFALMTKGRKGAFLSSLGIALILCFLYYVTTSVTVAIGKTGIMPPLLAVWSSHILFAAVGFFYIKSLP